VVEQDLDRALGFADRIVCMLEGKVMLEGRPAEFERAQITAAYFGFDESHQGEH
jgi:branched-chain amino acid transport system ATP-binding protein